MSSLSQPIAFFVATLPGAPSIFRRYGIDFCHQAKLSLEDVARAHHLEPDKLLNELMTTTHRLETHPASLSTAGLIDLILERFHAGHRGDLEELLHLSERVERTHDAEPGCPRGLQAQLQRITEDLEDHMQKEEQVLFPMMLSGGSPFIAAPIACMMLDHDLFGQQLAQIRNLTNIFTPPPFASTTWRTLYSKLQKFAEEAEEHVRLENNILFPRFTDGGAPRPE